MTDQDYLAIQRKLALYARGVDRGDAEALRNVYWPDAVDHHGVAFDGNAYAFIDFIVGTLSMYRASSHVMGQSHVVEAGSRAKSESYFMCYYVRKAPMDRHLEILAGRYLDDWEKRNSAWRILERTVVLDWTRIDPPSPDPVLPRPQRPVSGIGLTTRDDPSFKFFTGS
jgi:hypothetical protein